MKSGLDSFRNIVQKYPLAVFGFIGLQVIFIVFLIISFFNINQESQITASNDTREVRIEEITNKIDGVSGEVVFDIQHNLADEVLLNSDNVDLSNAIASIREGTLSSHEFEGQGLVAFSFVVDIPTLEQSYQIYYLAPQSFESRFSANRNPKAVLCLDEYSEKVYPNFECQSSYPFDTRYRMINDYVSYLTFADFALTINPKAPATINLSIFDDTTDLETQKAYVIQTKEAVSSLGVSPELFKYEILPQ